MKRVWLLLSIVGVTGLAFAQVTSPAPQISDHANKVDDSPASTGHGSKPTKQELFHPNAVAVAMGVAVPGAVVCRDLASVRVVATLYMQHWEDNEQDAVTHGTSKVLRGPPSPAPKPSTYGCFLVPAGTPVQVTTMLTGVLALTSRTSDGHTIHGVTQSNMVGPPPEQSETEGVKSSSQETRPEASEPVRPGVNGVGFPRCTYCPDASFPEEERARNFSGTVRLQIVVGVDGHTGDIQVVDSLGHDFDEAAVAAVTQWRFKPAAGPNGAPVPTIAVVEVNFRSTVNAPAGR